jgi:hypothetical protein
MGESGILQDERGMIEIALRAQVLSHAAEEFLF